MSVLNKSLRNLVVLLLFLTFSLFIGLVCILAVMKIIKNNINSIGENEYVNYDSDNLLTSDMESKEYKCHGSCFCEHNGRRSVSRALGSLKYFVAAITSLSAIKFAKNHFEDECVKEYSDSCPTASIHSVLDGCGIVHMDDEDDDYADVVKESWKKSFFEVNDSEDEEEIFWDPIEDTKEQQYLSFQCYGECLTRKWEYLVDEPGPIAKLNKYAENSDCGQLKLNEIMHKYIPREEILADQFFIYRGKQGDQEAFANLVFMHYTLQPFCKKMSEQQHFFEKTMDIWKDNYCVGFVRNKHDHPDNPTVQCAKLDLEDFKDTKALDTADFTVNYFKENPQGAPEK